MVVVEALSLPTRQVPQAAQEAHTAGVAVEAEQAVTQRLAVPAARVAMALSM